MGWLDGIGGALVGGVTGLIGGIVGNEQNANSAQKAAEFNAVEAAKNRQFQNDMSATAHRREMEDLRAAGLNPMLAVMKGGASTPGGATASMTPAKMEDALGKGVSSALDSRRLAKELDATASQVSLNKATEAKAEADKKLSEQSAKNAELNAKVTEAQLPAVKAQSQYEKKKADADSHYLPFDAIQQRARSTLGTVNSAVDLFKPRMFGGGGTDTIMNHKGEIVYEGPKGAIPRSYRNR